MNLAIINFGSGNLHSVHKAFESVSSDLSNPYNIIVTNDPKEIQSADKIVLPGVGAFGDCKNAILNIEGLHASLEVSVIKTKSLLWGYAWVCSCWLIYHMSLVHTQALAGYQVK